MNSALRGKKLVVLGGAPNESTLVRRAQELGVYVIVADYYTDRKLSPAKEYADDAWDINWMDVDKMVELCEENHVDGITAGYSEVKIDYLIRICQRLNLPCYCTSEQLEITRDKIKFKEVCKKNLVPVVKEYSSIEVVDKYPVIVKPTDRAGSIGISVAHNYSELVVAYDYAMKASLNKSVIIEEYITDTKIDVYYLVNNGQISILTTNDVIMANNNGTEKVVQSCWLYPHRYERNFRDKVDLSLKNMIKDMGIKYGCIFFSGFIDKDKDYKFFECGFRLEGAHQYNYTYSRGLVNFLDVFIAHALTGNIDCVIPNDTLNEELKLAIINIYAKAGKIGQINGIDDIEKMKDCSLTMIKANIGDLCEDNVAILNKVAMFEFNNESADSLSKDVEQAYKTFQLLDEFGNDMVYDRVDVDLIKDWWE